MDSPNLIVKTKRDRAIRQRHPWLFSGAIARLDNEAKDGELVDVISSEGEWLARGYLNRGSQIVVRLLSWEQKQKIDVDFWRARIVRACAGRASLQATSDITAYRLINAESDGLPGLIVDRYGEWLVFQALTLGIERRKQELVNILADSVDGIRGIYERSDADVRRKELLEPISGCLSGDEPPELVEVLENGLRFLVDIKRGHKTGFYLDQRENREKLPAFCENAGVLNAFSYTGAFGVYALSGGATNLVNVDTANSALALALRHISLNGYSEAKAENLTEDVFSRLRAFRAVGQLFDVIILDPPRFAASRSHIRRASRGYKDINWVALQILRPGGVLFTFSCSGLISRELFQKIVFGAALDAGRDVQIIGHLSQASDHPTAVNFPEGEYLKGLICRVW